MLIFNKENTFLEVSAEEVNARTVRASASLRGLLVRMGKGIKSLYNHVLGRDLGSRLALLKEVANYLFLHKKTTFPHVCLDLPPHNHTRVWDSGYRGGYCQTIALLAS